MTSRRKRIAGTAALAVIVMLGPLGGPAWAADDKPGFNEDPKAGSNAAEAIMTAQAPLVAAAQKFTDLDTDATLGGIELLVEKRAINLWWKGTVPDQVLAEIEQQRAAGVGVNLRSSKYAQRELVEAVHSLTSYQERLGGLVSIGPNVDGSGLNAQILEGAKVDLSMLSFPVAIQVGQPIQQWSRRNDSPPWWAGGVTRANSPSVGVCSTGFAVARYFLWWETERGVLTAEHCAPGGGIDFLDGAGDLIGPAEDAFASGAHGYHSDSLFIRTNSGARTFDGGVGVGEFSKPVAGLVTNFVGQFVCTSGAATGVHCDIRTDQAHRMAQLFPSLTFVQEVVLGHNVNGQAAGGLGDSGGPVFTLTAGFTKVFAAGLINGGGTPVACNQPGITGCGNMVAFTDMGYVTIAQKVRILTS